MHFAGLKSIKESMINPYEYWDNNVNGSINLFNIMNENDCHKIVFSSSATIYGQKSHDNIDENSPIFPINTYGNTKYTIEKGAVVVKRKERVEAMNKIQNILIKFISKDKILIWK